MVKTQKRDRVFVEEMKIQLVGEVVDTRASTPRGRGKSEIDEGYPDDGCKRCGTIW